VARWRKAERSRLIELRCALPAEDRALHTAAIVRKLDEIISARANEIVSVYWPIRGEPDLRSWMRAASLRGLRVALPVAVELGQPMTFREWRPDSAMARGLWKIPYPAAGPDVVPTTVLAPLVGFDSKCYRLVVRGCHSRFASHGQPYPGPPNSRAAHPPPRSQHVAFGRRPPLPAVFFLGSSASACGTDDRLSPRSLCSRRTGLGSVGSATHAA
jgi:5,10-methenyltetrahydrofolate synthetase